MMVADRVGERPKQSVWPCRMRVLTRGPAGVLPTARESPRNNFALRWNAPANSRVQAGQTSLAPEEIVAPGRIVARGLR
jgi:hypothetical protein